MARNLRASKINDLRVISGYHFDPNVDSAFPQSFDERKIKRRTEMTKNSDAARARFRMLREAVMAVCIAFCFPGLAVSASAQAPKIISFDVPASNGNGTVPIGVNLAGTITGWYWDASGVAHGFLRSADGTYTTIDGPNAPSGTLPVGINLFGAVAGFYNDADFVSHGFVRAPDGKFTTFEAPGADTNPADAAGTLVSGINAFGAISGYYVDSNFIIHGYLRTPDGKFTSFDVPGSGIVLTIPDGPLNLEGAMGGVLPRFELAVSHFSPQSTRQDYDI